MKRFRRMLSRGANVICILLMVVTVVMFIKGYWIIRYNADDTIDFAKAEKPWWPRFNLNFQRPVFSIPHWFLFLIFAIKPTWSLVAWRRRKRRLRRGDKPCPACGYDLRGNPDAESCPECGASVARGSTV